MIKASVVGPQFVKRVVEQPDGGILEIRQGVIGGTTYDFMQIDHEGTRVIVVRKLYTGQVIHYWRYAIER